MFRDRLDPLARRFGLYTAYALTESEYVGTKPYNERQTSKLLKRRGYTITPRYLTALKYHWETGETHSVSLRRVDPENERKQFHVHLFGRWVDEWDLETYNGPVVTDIASHYEYRPDLTKIGDESHAERVERLQTHYRPEYGKTYLRGRMCDRLKKLEPEK